MTAPTGFTGHTEQSTSSSSHQPPPEAVGVSSSREREMPIRPSELAHAQPPPQEEPASPPPQQAVTDVFFPVAGARTFSPSASATSLPPPPGESQAFASGEQRPHSR